MSEGGDFALSLRSTNMRVEPGSALIVDIVGHADHSRHTWAFRGPFPVFFRETLSAIRGRDFSTPDDVRDIAAPVLRHRLTLRAEAELDGATPDSVISDILQTAEVPR